MKITRQMFAKFLLEDHIGINLADAMEAALGLWGLDATKQVYLTVDNGSNILVFHLILFYNMNAHTNNHDTNHYYQLIQQSLWNRPYTETLSLSESNNP